MKYDNKLQFDTSLSPQEIEQNFAGVDVFSGIMDGLEEALAHEKELREAHREQLVRQTAGSMALSGLDLTEEDKDRIRYLVDHPNEKDAMLEELIQKHTAGGRKPTGVRACNGEIREGDLVRYEDGWLCFTARIVRQEGAFGFFLDDTYQELRAFLKDFPDAKLDLTIIKEA